jgi:hypothetical protein
MIAAPIPGGLATRLTRAYLAHRIGFDVFAMSKRESIPGAE